MTLVGKREELLKTEVRLAANHHALVMLQGELDASTAGLLFQRFGDLAREGISHVALNLAELTFIDTTGLSVIVAAHKRTETMGGELIIFSPRPTVRRMFEMTGLIDYLNIRPAKASSAPSGPPALPDHTAA